MRKLFGLLSGLALCFSMSASFAADLCGVPQSTCPTKDPNSACNMSLSAKNSLMSTYCQTKKFTTGCSEKPQCAEGDFACQISATSRSAYTKQFCKAVAPKPKKSAAKPANAKAIQKTIQSALADTPTKPSKQVIPESVKPKKQMHTPIEAFNFVTKPLSSTPKKGHSDKKEDPNKITFHYY